jgi:hypothetical protein
MAAYGYTSWHQTTVGKTEAGKRPLRLNELISLAALFNVSPTVLLIPERDLADIAAEIRRTEQAQAQAASQAADAKSELDAATAHRSGAEQRHQRAERELERVETDLAALRSLEDILRRQPGQETGEDA